MISSEQIRAARALLRWEQRDLATKSGVSLPTIKRLETIPGELAAKPETVAAIVAAFKKGGLEFTNGDQPGVRLKKGANGDRAASLPIEDLNSANDE